MKELSVVAVALLLSANSVMADDDINDLGHLRWQRPTDDQETMWIIACIAGGIGISICVAGILGHLRAWCHPVLQNFFIRELFVLASIGVSAVVALLLPATNALCFAIRVFATGMAATVYLNVVQAYFAPFLTPPLQAARVVEVLKYLSDVDDAGQLQPTRFRPPLCGSAVLNEKFLSEQVKLPVRVYQVVSVFIPVLAVGLQSYGYMGVGSDDSERAWLSLVALQLFFGVVAAAALLALRQALSRVLVGPTPQMASVFIVLLVLPLQELIMAIIATSGDSDNYFGLELVSQSNTVILNSLLCFEVMVLSVLFYSAWGPDPFQEAMVTSVLGRTWLTSDIILPDPVHTDDVDSDAGDDTDGADAADVAVDVAGSGAGRSGGVEESKAGDDAGSGDAAAADGGAATDGDDITVLSPASQPQPSPARSAGDHDDRGLLTAV